ncbi:MAG TPA: hypothetical protein VLH85_04450 [Levilinea sp.]|nr:hypothetical protein [Levilinea sp.]
MGWAPQTAYSDWPVATPAAFPVCLDASSFSQLLPLPAGLNGTVLFTEVDTGFRLALSGLDGRNRHVLAEQTSRGAFSPDGNRIAYPGEEGIVILDLATNTTDVLQGDGFVLRSVTVHTGASHDLFALDGSSLKAPYPDVSPDAQWVAYRASDNSSVYLLPDTPGTVEGISIP